MTDELGDHFRIAVVVVMTAGLLGVVVGVLIFALLNMGNTTDKYETSMALSATGSIYDLSRERKVTCPQAYASIIEAGGEIREVIYYEKDIDFSDDMNDDTGTNLKGKRLYMWDGSVDDLLWLLTVEQSRENVKIRITRSDNIVPNLVVNLIKVTDASDS